MCRRGGADVEKLRGLARDGLLAAAVRTASATELRSITGSAYDLGWPIVFSRLTRRLERRRGHPDCAAAVHRLADDCLDRFYDDVEAVVDDLLVHATKPIGNLEAWIGSRLNAATVNGHRRLRGRRGALQRPRIPGWLAADLGHDRWLTTLATEILVWVGIAATAGTGVWPVDGWAQRRAAVTGDWQGSDPVTIASDVETVLAAMRRRPTWYLSYVETPLGRKHAPVASVPWANFGAEPPLSLAEPDGPEDARLNDLAAAAVQAIGLRIGRGEDVASVVVDVVATVFRGDRLHDEIDRPPHAAPAYDERVSLRLADQSTVDRIVSTVLDILAERDR
jgi:hypothetical protein